MHNNNSNVNSNSVQKEEVFCPQKLFTIGNKSKISDAPCKPQLYGFPRQRQCGGHLCAAHVATGNKGMMVGELQ